MGRLNQQGRGCRGCNCNSEMHGEGILDMGKAMYQKAKMAGNLASRAYGSSIGKKAINMLPSSDDTARQGYAGEKHAILQLENGRYGVANYMGPGTEVIKRLERNDPPRTKSDRVAMRHDIDYALAQNASSREEQVKLIRQADNTMVNSLNRISKEKGDRKKNIFQGRRGIQAKMMAEDSGVMNKGSYSGELKRLTDHEKQLLNKHKQSLVQQGYGVSTYVGSSLKKKILKSMMKEAQKGDGLRLSGQRGGFIFSTALLIAGLTAGAKATALGVAGAIGAHAYNSAVGNGVMDMIAKVKLTKKDFSKQVIKAVDEELDKIQTNASNSSDMKKQIMAKVAKPLLPLVKNVLHKKIKQKMGGNGLKLAGDGLSLAGGNNKKIDTKILKIAKQEIFG